MFGAEVVSYSNSHRSVYFTLTPTFLLSSLATIFFLIAFAFYSGGKYSVEKYSKTYLYEYFSTLDSQKIEILQAKQEAASSLDFLATRLSQLQGQIMRLNALGSRMAEQSQIDEIDFSNEIVGIGGSIPETEQQSHSVPNFMSELEQLTLQVNENNDKLFAMESMLLEKTISHNAFPSIMPIRAYVSSWFGWRDDPLKKHNRKSFHEGMDFSADIGAHIKSVAAGVVSWSGPKDNYGNFIEIDHGNGYVSRYAHTHEIFVLVGEKVNKGQLIASVGISGRSTGPHLHFEIEKDGKYVDPKNYMVLN